MNVKEMNLEQRPREKALRYGIGTLADAELLSLVLGSGTRTVPVLELAQKVLDEMGGFSGLERATPARLMKIHGIREVKALQIAASFAMARRSLRQDAYSTHIYSGEDVARWFMSEYGNSDQEHFIVVFLDTKSRIIHHQDLYIGTLNESPVHPREIFREAFLHAAHSILLVHNHPSGDCMPSKTDIETTRNLLAVSKTMEVALLDHIIVSHNSWVSLRDMELFDPPQS